jgi:hypothetical protein
VARMSRPPKKTDYCLARYHHEPDRQGPRGNALCRSRDGARRLLTADIEQRLVDPHVFVTGGDQEAGTWRERQVSRDLRKPLHKMARVQRHEEVGRAGQIASPYVPARRTSLRRVPQAMYWPAPAMLEQ